jgi:hypothetical protein
MSQKSSVPQAASFVSVVLKRDTASNSTFGVASFCHDRFASFEPGGPQKDFFFRPIRPAATLWALVSSALISQ